MLIARPTIKAQDWLEAQVISQEGDIFTVRITVGAATGEVRVLRRGADRFELLVETGEEIPW